MKPSEILEKAFKKIEKPEGWTQGSYAKGADGEQVDTYSKAATCYCSMGALRTTEEYRSGGYKSLEYLLAAMPEYTVPAFNDTHTHAEVCAVWQEAIANAKADEAKIA